MKINDVPLSILDLSLVREGFDASDAINESIAYAQLAEELGFKRIWFSEHHNHPGIASSATAVLIGHVASKTQTIRVGSGGIMLPNHSPLQVAEAFGTLETIYPNRIDLGLGRAPGTDGLTAQALRRGKDASVDSYPQDIAELLLYLGEKQPNSRVNAYPGSETFVPIWILGSSPYSAQLAAYFGLPYAFASHFAPTYLNTAMKLYRDEFKPSEFLKEPYFMPAVNILIAETDEEAKFQSTTSLQMAQNIVTQQNGKLQPPVKDMDALWKPGVQSAVEQMRKYSFIGTAKKVKNDLEEFIETTSANELLITSYFYNPEDREKSFHLLKEVMEIG